MLLKRNQVSCRREGVHNARGLTFSRLRQTLFSGKAIVELPERPSPRTRGQKHFHCEYFVLWVLAFEAVFL